MSEATNIQQLVFPDTNVLIQGRALHELPWDELGISEIEVIICGPVIRELDRLKNRGGRAARVARAMSTTVRELMSAPAKSDILRERGPRVVRRLLLGLSVREPVRPGLDLSHDDQAIINQALARLDAGDNVVLLTDDNFAAMTAEEYGLPVRLMPAHWLKEPEIDDSGKEIARRDAEIARLKSAEPMPQLGFADAAGKPIKRLEVTMARFLPVPHDEVERLARRLADAAPLAAVQVTATSSLNHSFKRGRLDLADLTDAGQSLPPIPVTQADIDKYQADHVAWLDAARLRIANFHKEWNRRRIWPSGTLLAVNSGNRPAEDVLVEVESSGPFLISGQRKAVEEGTSWLSLARPPEAPRVRPRTLGSITGFDRLFPEDSMRNLITPLTMPNLRRDDDRFYWREGKSDPVEAMKLECKVWRHGPEEEDFPFHIWADDEKAVSGLIIGRIRASNLTDIIEERLPLRLEFEDRDTTPLAERLVEQLEKQLLSKV